MNTTPVNKTFETYELFKYSFDQANFNRDHALELDSPRAALNARLQYIAQIVASVVSVPFIIIAGIYDMLKCNGNLLNIPVAIFAQVFIILPLSILGAILPMSWNRGIDNCLSNCTRESRINNLLLDCHFYLEEHPKRSQRLQNNYNDDRIIATIEEADIEEAIKRSNQNMKAKAEASTRETIIDQLLAPETPPGSPQHADLYKIYTCKENELNRKTTKTIAQLATLVEQNTADTVEHKNWAEALARRWAKGAQTIPQLRALLDAGNRLANAPVDQRDAIIAAEAAAAAPFAAEPFNVANIQTIANPFTLAAIASAIVKKYVAQHTLDQLRQLLRNDDQAAVAAPEERADIETAIQEKDTFIKILASCEKIEVLRTPPPNANAITRCDYQNALTQKSIYLSNNLARVPLNELQARLARSRNPTEKSDLREAIIRNYFQTNSYSSLLHLWTQAPVPKDLLLGQALGRMNAEIDRLVAEKTQDLIEVDLVTAAPANPDDQPSNICKNHKEALLRKYLLKTLAELEAPRNPEPHPIVKEVLLEAQRTVQQLADTKPLAELIRLHAAQNNQVQKASLAAAIEKRRTEVTRLRTTLTWSDLNVQLNAAAANTVRQSHLSDAKNQKSDVINALVAANTLEQLQALHDNENQPINKDDLVEAIARKERSVQDLADTKPLAELIRLHAAQNNQVQKASLAAAIEKRRTEVTRLRTTLTWNELNAQWKAAAANTASQSRLSDAKNQKADVINALVAANTLEQLQVLRNNENQPINKDDLSVAIRSKIERAATTPTQ
jgi:hypothetical protein